MPSRLIATSVFQGADLVGGEAGLFLLDLQKHSGKQAIRLDRCEIDWERRGFEVGFRGIAIDGDAVYLMAGDELFAYTPRFELIGSWRNHYLKQCREICIHQRSLFLVSSAYDSILRFDLDEHAFDWALHAQMHQFRFKAKHFDPNGDDGPLPLNKLRLTDVFTNDNGMYICGLNTNGMLHFSGKNIRMSVELPPLPQNARPFRNGVLFIDNEIRKLRYSGRENDEEDRALPLPGPGRGLCLLNERAAAVGSAPSTITLFDLQENQQLLSVQLSKDDRSAIHSLAVWPF